MYVLYMPAGIITECVPISTGAAGG